MLSVLVHSDACAVSLEHVRRRLDSLGINAGFSGRSRHLTSHSLPNWSKATRRATRRTAALANELNMHSFRIHIDGTVTWTLFHKHLGKAKPAAMDKPDAGKAMDSQMREPSKRELRSRERARSHAALMQKAQAFRARSIIFATRHLSRISTGGVSPNLVQGLVGGGDCSPIAGTAG